MFNEKLFYEICERYGVEIREGKGRPQVYDDGVLRDITKNDIDEMFRKEDIMDTNKNEVFVECECKKNAGWLEIKENDYEIDCNNCGRIYTIKNNGEIVLKSS